MSRYCNTPPEIFRFVSDTADLSEEAALRCNLLLETPVQAVSVPAWQYGRDFGATCVFEAVFFWLLLRGISRFSCGKSLALWFGVNLFSHPLIYFAGPWAASKFGISYGNYVGAAEIFAPLSEIIICCFFRCRLVPSVMLIVAANLFSWWIGAAFY